jgi:Secretion system C-terminal sorting domain
MNKFHVKLFHVPKDPSLHSGRQRNAVMKCLAFFISVRVQSPWPSPLYNGRLVILSTAKDLPEESHKDQFYVELDKGQLFRTIGQPLIAKYVFDHLGDCQLDSLEQVRLNEWQQTVDIELAMRSAYFNDSLYSDTIAVFVDTTLYPIPYNVTLSNYYFGVWIGGPQDVAFVHCGENLQFRSYMTEKDNWTIYPNPAHDRISVSSPADDRAVLTIYDAMGRMAYQELINFGEQHSTTIQLDLQWPAGNYLLCKESNGTAAFKQFVVTR